MVDGQWSMVNSSRFTVHGKKIQVKIKLSSIVNGRWSMVNGQWSMVNRQWSMVNGQSSLQ
jgi:hypothetical protein